MSGLTSIPQNSSSSAVLTTIERSVAGRTAAIPVASFAPPVPPERSATFNAPPSSKQVQLRRTHELLPIAGRALEHVEAVHDHDGNTSRLAHQQLGGRRDLVGYGDDRRLEGHTEIIRTARVIDERRQPRHSERDIDQPHAPCPAKR